MGLRPLGRRLACGPKAPGGVGTGATLAGRWPCRARGGASASVRASGASSNAFRSGCASFRNLRHCSIGSNTAASTPRLVTICGPSLALASRNALNRAFAS